MARLSNDIRHTTRWKSLSEYMRKKYPLCYNPLGLCNLKPCDDVHHIVPVRVNPKLAYDKQNLVCLCRSCHAQVEAIERRWGNTAFLFNKQYVGGVIKSLNDVAKANARPVYIFSCLNEGGGGLKCFDTKEVRIGAKGSIWCSRMRTFTSNYCGNCKRNRERLNNE